MIRVVVCAVNTRSDGYRNIMVYTYMTQAKSLTTALNPVNAGNFCEISDETAHGQGR